MVSNGIASDRIRAEAFGETRPVASNDTAEGRAQNRRVEIIAR
jgi:OOP family OmpA-OmpF porin